MESAHHRAAQMFHPVEGMVSQRLVLQVIDPHQNTVGMAFFHKQRKFEAKEGLACIRRYP